MVYKIDFISFNLLSAMIIVQASGLFSFERHYHVCLGEFKDCFFKAVQISI